MADARMYSARYVPKMLDRLGNRLSVHAACCETDACKMCCGSCKQDAFYRVNQLVRSELCCTCSLASVGSDGQEHIF